MYFKGSYDKSKSKLAQQTGLYDARDAASAAKVSNHGRLRGILAQVDQNGGQKSKAHRDRSRGGQNGSRRLFHQRVQENVRFARHGRGGQVGEFHDEPWSFGDRSAAQGDEPTPECGLVSADCRPAERRQSRPDEV